MANSKLDNQGLYQSSYEHDACGVGMVVNIHGGKSHELVDNALKVLENMEHRGAETRDKQATEPVSWYRFHMSLFSGEGIPVPGERQVRHWFSSSTKG